MKIAAQYIFTNCEAPLKNGFIEFEADTIIKISQFKSGIQESYEMIFFNGIIIPCLIQIFKVLSDSDDTFIKLSASDIISQYARDYCFEKQPTIIYKSDALLSQQEIFGQLKQVNDHFEKYNFEEILKWFTIIPASLCGSEEGKIAINVKPNFVGIDAFNFETMTTTTASKLNEFKF